MLQCSVTSHVPVTQPLPLDRTQLGTRKPGGRIPQTAKLPVTLQKLKCFSHEYEYSGRPYFKKNAGKLGYISFVRSISKVNQKQREIRRDWCTDNTITSTSDKGQPTSPWPPTSTTTNTQEMEKHTHKHTHTTV